MAEAFFSYSWRILEPYSCADRGQADLERRLASSDSARRTWRPELQVDWELKAFQLAGMLVLAELARAYGLFGT